jgi:hypothetical protein
MTISIDVRIQEYVDFVVSIGYVFTETVLDINFLIVPADASLQRAEADANFTRSKVFQ